MPVLLIYLEVLDNEPMGLLYVGTALKNKGYPIKIVGSPIGNFQKQVLSEVHAFKPRTIGISITTPMVNKAQEIARAIKSQFPEITIIAGGPHPTVLPYDTLKPGNIDICVIGEGDETILDLMESLRSGRPLKEVKGVAFLDNGSLVVTEKRPYIQDLDTLPFVDRQLMPKEVIYGRAGYPLGNPCMFMMTVRGCPYQCSFCQPTVDKIFGPQVRRRSAENVISEIIELKTKYHIHGLWINDDTFTFDKAWAERFCDLMIEHNLDILWYTQGRINNMDEGLLTKMRDAGCAGLVLTPESGSQRIRNEVLNKNVSDEQVIGVYAICHKIGLPAQANIMLGSPTETEEDLALSLSLIKRIQPYFMNFSYTTALPGTYMYEKYGNEIGSSQYYNNYENYDIGVFKKLNMHVTDDKLRSSWDYFKKMYANSSFSNRARHFFREPYFRRILLKRWKTLIFSRHPKFRHIVFDFLAIIFGSFYYFKNKYLYESDFKNHTFRN